MKAGRSARPLVAVCVWILFVTFPLFAGGSQEELSPDQAEQLQQQAHSDILAKTVNKPGSFELPPGKVGGTWTATINNDPKTFNELAARDADTGTVTGVLFDYLADYDPYKREWKSNLASFKIEADQKNDKMRVVFTLRDDLFWTLPGQKRAEDGVKVTSDDVIFWYNEIDGDKALQQPGYSSQFVDMPDGSEAHITIEKIDDRSFAFNYPRIVANPILSSNMQFGPRYIYQPAKKSSGVEGVLNLFSVDADVTKIPSIGMYHIVEYTPGVRVVLQRNPFYWKKDKNGTSLPYIQKIIYRIVPDQNTEFLLFKEGQKDSYGPRPEDLQELVNQKDPDYTVYNGGETLGSNWMVFNQNPQNMDPVVNGWFTQTKFRQAMSCLLNRKRISDQVYRGLASPAEYLFPRPNPMFNPDIKLQYTYDRNRALKLLSEIGMKRDADGVMRDKDGNAVEFDIIMGVETNIGIDIANIFADELSQVGIKLNVRPIDFQKLVESMTSTYDWEMMLFGGWSIYWPSSGSNVWQSSGNFHLWHPLQEKPATEWEARLDHLYNEGRFTIDQNERRAIYDEYQKIILNQTPVLFIVHPLSFNAVRNKWKNVTYDTLMGLRTEYLYLNQ